ncbi:MAG: Co2+/Mg2+ efflux protein ApaG, partial [Brachymonas sp.]
MPKYQISVKVRPEYLPDRSNPDAGEYVFAYHVTISNTGQIAAQVIARTWNINHASGLHEKIKGLAVVGHQPLLQPGEVFEYSSGCVLT